MKVYTFIALLTALERLQVKGHKITKRDLAVLNQFAGQQYTKQDFLAFVENFIKTSPGYGKRGGKPGYEVGYAKLIWNWWFKQGAVVELV